MGRTTRVYSRVDEADPIIRGICEKQPEAMWCVRPETIAVMGIDNVERSKKNHVLAKIKPIKGAEKAIFQQNNIPVRYVIECFWSDWNTWNDRQKQWILFHELLHVHPDFEKTIKHDCEDFKLILDKVGVDWWDKKDSLPSLLNDKVDFNLDLRPGLKDLQDEDDGDEIKDDPAPKKPEVTKVDEVIDEKDDEISDEEIFSEEDEGL